MANKTNSLSHTKWMCKYHIVFTPNYRRKVIFNQYRESLIEIFRLLCKYKGVERLEGHMMPDHVHILVSTLICMMAFTSKASGEFKSAAFFMCKVKSDRNR